MLDPLVVHWLTERRGITEATAEAFGLRTEGRDLIMPYPEGLQKSRWSKDKDNPFGLQKEGRVFTWHDEEGSITKAAQVPYLPPDYSPAPYVIITEGETDTMATWQAQGDDKDKFVVFGLSGLNAWKEGYVEKYMADAKRVFVVLDNDDPYKNPDAAKAGEAAWLKLRESLGRKARRVKLPQGCEDLAEFFVRYDWAALLAVLRKANEPRRHFARVDLSQPIPATDWIVEEFLEAGSVTVIAGDSGVGKSLLSSSLAIAIAKGEPTWCGLDVKKHGYVMIVDEENMLPLVLQRLSAMGLTEEADRANIDYMSYQGVDMFNTPDLLLEQAMDHEPILIIIDSQSAVSIGAEENSNDDMTRLFKRAFRPLARLTGAAVLILHHTPKDAKGIPRGAGAIKAQADQVLSVVPEVVGGMTIDNRVEIFPSKPRRWGRRFSVEYVGDMEVDGFITVQAVKGAL